jgi:hypothetical protein
VKIAGGWDWAWATQSVSYEFEFVPPEGYEDVWVATFDPKILTFSSNKENMDWPGADLPFKTNLTLTLNPSADPKLPTQDLNLKINIWREDIGNTLVFMTPPQYPITYREEYLNKTADQPQRFFDVDEGDYLTYKLLLRWTLILKNIPLPDYERRIENVVDILVKVKKEHRAQIVSPLPLEIKPYELKSIPVTVRNLGSHVDTFNFRVKTDAEGMIVTPPPALTLDPGEEGQAFIGVAAPRRFLSVGTTNTIELEAYSIDDPETVFSNTIILSTTGIHVSGSNIYYSALLLTIFIIFIFFLLFVLKRKRRKIIERPDKPWEISEEKKHLEELRKKDRKEYRKVMQMMEDEYDSSLLWYKYYTDSELRKRKATRLKRKKQKEKELEKLRKEKIKSKEEKIKAREKKKKEEEKKRIEEKAKEEEEKTPEFEEKEPESPEETEIIQYESEKKTDEQIRKEQTLLRIKQQQERQKRKLNK